MKGGNDAGNPFLPNNQHAKNPFASTIQAKNNPFLSGRENTSNPFLNVVQRKENENVVEMESAKVETLQMKANLANQNIVQRKDEEQQNKNYPTSFQDLSWVSEVFDKDPGGKIYVLNAGGHNFNIGDVIKEINFALSIFGKNNGLILKIQAMLWEGTGEELKKHISQKSTMLIFGNTNNVSKIAKELYPYFDQGEFPNNINNPEVSSVPTKTQLPSDKDKGKFMDNNVILIKSEAFQHGQVMPNIYGTTDMSIKSSLKSIAGTAIHGLGHNSGMQYYENRNDRGHSVGHSIMSDGTELGDAIYTTGKGDIYNLIKNADKDLHKKISNHFPTSSIPENFENKLFTAKKDNTDVKIPEYFDPRINLRLNKEKKKKE